MEPHKFISDVLQGKERVLSFDDVALGPDMNITAGVLCALNFTRLAFAAEGSTPVLSQILTSLCSKNAISNALAICREWPSGVHLEVEDVYRIHLFEASLKLVSTNYDSPSPDHIASLLENLRALGSSAAILITRYPNVIACVRLRVLAQDVFVLFDPRIGSEHEKVTSLTFSTSVQQIAQRICEIFPLDKVHLAQENLDWQAKLLAKWDQSLIVSSLTLLTLRGELEELTRDNGNLKKKKQKLEESIVDLESRLVEEKAQTKRAWPSKPSVARSIAHGTFVARGRGSQPTRSSRSTARREYLLDPEDEIDHSMQFARQLQATFDSENELLLKQKHELMQTAQRQYHCGVCLDDFPEDDAVHVDECGHEICRDCARGHVCSKIEEHRFPVLCPVCMADNKSKNPGTILGGLVQMLGISEEQWATWEEMEIAQYSIPFNCRKCQHSGFVDRLDLEAQSEIHCPFPACDHVWCKKCQQTIESGGAKHSCDGTSELDHLMKQQGWRYCPNCKTPIQKLQGCNHLSCIAPGCNTHFCYRCGETINRTAIPREIQEGKTAHFRSCTLF